MKGETTMAIKKVDLVVIDPQEDFCNPSGALFVKGADADMKRLSTFVKRTQKKLHDIHVTLDSHHMVDVAHPVFWKDTKGNNPKPFTIITAQDVKDGVWSPSLPGCFQRMVNYVTALEKGQRYPLCIWPPHCLIGTPGAAIVPELAKELNDWCATNLSTIDFVAKGSNPFTEHYSAIQAEVPDPSDPKTSINAEFVQTLMEADLIAVAGEAGSHCLANTVRDIVKQFQDDKLVAKIVLLEDATSPVPGFEGLYTTFRDEMVAKVMKVSNTVDFLT